MNAPSRAAPPPTIQAASIPARVPVREATVAGVTKIPEPTMPPITTMVASKTPMRRASRSSITGTLYHGRRSSPARAGERHPRSCEEIVRLLQQFLRRADRLRRGGRVGGLQQLVDGGDPGIPRHQRRRMLLRPRPGLLRRPLQRSEALVFRTLLPELSDLLEELGILPERGDQPLREDELLLQSVRRGLDPRIHAHRQLPFWSAAS